MSHKVKANENGDIVISHEVFRELKPNAEYEIEQEGNALKVRPTEANPAEELDVEQLQEEAKRLWTERTPAERSAALRKWMNSPRPNAPILSDESLRRENIYD